MVTHSRFLYGMNADHVCKLADEFGVTVQDLRSLGKGVYAVFQGTRESITNLRLELESEDY